MRGKPRGGTCPNVVFRAPREERVPICREPLEKRPFARIAAICKVRIRQLVEAGGLVYEAGLLGLDATALRGALIAR